LPTGQSGNPFSAHYSDQAALYNAGKFRRMLLNKDEIVRTSTIAFFPGKN
jgi:penicillin amidase